LGWISIDSKKKVEHHDFAVAARGRLATQRCPPRTLLSQNQHNHYQCGANNFWITAAAPPQLASRNRFSMMLGTALVFGPCDHGTGNILLMSSAWAVSVCVLRAGNVRNGGVCFATQRACELLQSTRSLCFLEPDPRVYYINLLLTGTEQPLRRCLATEHLPFLRRDRATPRMRLGSDTEHTARRLQL
jgi:hypothetical protein